jgi:hypothetical protein
VQGSGFSVNGLVRVEIIRTLDMTIADAYVATYSGGKLVVDTAVRYCPPNVSSKLFMVRAIDLLTMTSSNMASGAVCPGSGW